MLVFIRLKLVMLRFKHLAHSQNYTWYCRVLNHSTISTLESVLKYEPDDFVTVRLICIHLYVFAVLAATVTAAAAAVEAVVAVVEMTE